MSGNDYYLAELWLTGKEFWIVGLPDDKQWICAFVWLILIVCTVHITTQVFAIADLLQDNRLKAGRVQASEFEERGWQEETKYYTEIVEDEPLNDEDRESKAQITSRTDMVVPLLSAEQ